MIEKKTSILQSQNLTYKLAFYVILPEFVYGLLFKIARLTFGFYRNKKVSTFFPGFFAYVLCEFCARSTSNGKQGSGGMEAKFAEFPTNLYSFFLLKGRTTGKVMAAFIV